MSLGQQNPTLENNKDLMSRLSRCTELPSPVGVAVRILELGQDPEVTLPEVAEVISHDPALTTKLLRMANSPLYARQRKTENLRQAITLFGLEGTITLALSFSIVNNLHRNSRCGLDYDLFWRRSLAAGTCAQVLSESLGLHNKEDLFLAGLLQDIGMLALDTAVPDLYVDFGFGQLEHRKLQAHERQALGADHAEIGAWLLHRWNFPEGLRHAVSASHNPLSSDISSNLTQQAKVISVASDMADLWCSGDDDVSLDNLVRRAEQLLGTSCEAFLPVLEKSYDAMREIAHLFEVDFGDKLHAESILKQARELVTLRSIRAMQKSVLLEKTAQLLENRTRKLEEENRRDVLTGLYNRSYLDYIITEEIRTANRHSWQFAVLFVDLDGFKQINDTYGHVPGDQVIKAAAGILTDNTRGSDIIARYGGEEFVAVLPGTGVDGARMTSERLLQAFRTARHSVSAEVELVVTASIGIAVHGEGCSFNCLEDVVDAADRALYQAKHQGRDRYVFYSRADA